jgi:hypothetical protein
LTDLAQARGRAATLAARLLAAAGSRGEADLVALSALDLCVLGATEGGLFDPEVTREWRSWGRWKRARARSEVMESLRRRGLLPGGPGGDVVLGNESVTLASTLDLVLAALVFPRFVAVCRTGGGDRRPLKLYAVGDENAPLVAFVIEQPEARPPGDFPHLQKMGALGWLFSYLLVSPDRAWAVIAGWLIAPAGDGPRAESRTVALCRAGMNVDRPDVVLNALGDGSSAQVEFTLGGTDRRERFDEAGLRDVVRDVLTREAA